MNILRPLSPHRPIVQICVRYLFLATIVLFFYLLCLKLERMDWFQTLFDRVGGSLGGKALSFALRGWGCCCSAGLALTVGFALQALLTGEGFTNMMAPSGGSVTTWKEDTHEIDVLLESFSGTEDTGSSVNQPVGPPVPPANPVASPGEEEEQLLTKREEVKFLIRVLMQIGYNKRARNEKEIKQLFQDIYIDSERNATFLEELHDHLRGLRRPGGHGGTSGQPNKFSNIEVQELLRWISEKRGN